MKVLVIVESPAKAKPITKYLSRIDPSNSYTVLASYGHVRDLKRKELSVDTESGRFEPVYAIMPEKEDTVSRLQAAVKQADMVLLASDQDREGESIAWHVLELTRPKRVKRITFNEITENGLREALAHPRSIDMDLVSAQQARRVLDRLVGFTLSPILWKHFRAAPSSSGFQTLSAGRVQSATLKLIVDKENEVTKHDESQSYWTVQGQFDVRQGSKLAVTLEEARYYSGSTIKKWSDAKEVQAFLTSFQKTSDAFKLSDVKLHRTTVKPPLPFITSSLQQEANSKLGFDIKRTMGLAQMLYERGHITYMRTDSYKLSKDAQKQLRTEVLDRFGQDYLSEDKAGKDGTDDVKKAGKAVKGAQEAHEAIRPTQASVYPLTKLSDTDNGDNKQAAKLYALIWQRAMASQMAPANYEEVDIRIACPPHPTNDAFVGKVKNLTFPGYLAVYDGVQQTAAAAPKDNVPKAAALFQMLKVEQGDQKIAVVGRRLMARHTWTSAPSRYNEAMLVKQLEKLGIGRPSTYAATLSKLYEKQYVIKQNMAGRTVPLRHFHYDLAKRKLTLEESSSVIDAETSRIIPTKVGSQIDEYLREHFADLVDSGFTAAMEEELDAIADGTKTDIQVLARFWKAFKRQCSLVKGTKKIPSATEELAEQAKLVHRIDGQDVVVRLAKYGPVIQYQENKYIGLKPYLMALKKGYMDLDERDIRFLISLPLPIAGGAAQLHYGRYGVYIKVGDEGFSIPYSIQKIIGSKAEPWKLATDLTKAQVKEIVKSKREAMEKKKEAPPLPLPSLPLPSLPLPPPLPKRQAKGHQQPGPHKKGRRGST